MNRLYLFCLLLLTSCYKVPDILEPKLQETVQDHYLSSLPSPFPPLSEEEAKTDWGKEMVIAHAFAESSDLYRAISTLKRAEILLPKDEMHHRLEIEYDIVLSYFLAKRYHDAIATFEKGNLAHVDVTFPAHHDLLLTLFECYREVDLPEKEEAIYTLLTKSYPATAEKVALSCALREGNLPKIAEFAQGFAQTSYLDEMTHTYEMGKKSIFRAQALNALLPGAGYLYIGQKKSALTAFLLNTLFITAAVQFFRHNHLAAGIITTGFEAGWYFGGIYGAGEEAKYYNERLYESQAETVLNDYHLFPTLLLQHEF